MIGIAGGKVRAIRVLSDPRIGHRRFIRVRVRIGRRTDRGVRAGCGVTCGCVCADVGIGGATGVWTYAWLGRAGHAVGLVPRRDVWGTRIRGTCDAVGWVGRCACVGHAGCIAGTGRVADSASNMSMGRRGGMRQMAHCICHARGDVGTCLPNFIDKCPAEVGDILDVADVSYLQKDLAANVREACASCEPFGSSGCTCGCNSYDNIRDNATERAAGVIRPGIPVYKTLAEFRKELSGVVGNPGGNSRNGIERNINVLSLEFGWSDLATPETTQIGTQVGKAKHHQLPQAFHALAQAE